MDSALRRDAVVCQLWRFVAINAGMIGKTHN
jgi:hypothetical protein